MNFQIPDGSSVSPETRMIDGVLKQRIVIMSPWVEVQPVPGAVVKAQDVAPRPESWIYEWRGGEGYQPHVSILGSSGAEELTALPAHWRAMNAELGFRKYILIKPGDTVPLEII